MANPETKRRSNPVADDAFWEKNPHGFRLGQSFKTFKDAVIYATSPDLASSPTNEEGIKEFIGTLPAHFAAPNHTDTTIGGNDAINALWQFGVDDDIVHPILASDSSSKNEDPQAPSREPRGLGRVYNEVYQSNMHLLWLRFGVPRFSKLSSFWLSGTDPGVARLMNEGPGASAANIGRMMGNGLALAFALPFLPIIGAVKFISSIEDMPITKYYALRPTMSLYYRMVNVILSQLAVNMGLFPNSVNNAVTPDGKIDSTYVPPEKRPSTEAPENFTNTDALPELLRNGPDIFSIMDKRRARVAGGRPHTTDELTEEMNKKSSLLLDIIGGIKHATEYAFGLTDYVGFRIEKGTDASETVNNTTGESQIASTINAKASAGRDKQFSSAGGKLGIPGLDQVIGFTKGAIEGIGANIGAGAATTIVSGNGFYDIPEVWKSSSFTKSYSFSIQLRAKYGDPVSIYQSIYIPLAMLLAAALPRGTGKNTYTSPFILEAYSRGMFAIPLGIIESLSIRRGLAEFGWTHSFFPTAVDVTINIKDLSPAFFLSLATARDMVSFKANTTMEEYMATLSGLNIRERTFLADRLVRRAKALLRIGKVNVFNPLCWANMAGESSLVRFVSNTLPFWTTPSNEPGRAGFRNF